MCWELVRPGFSHLSRPVYEVAKGELGGEVIVLVGLAQGHSNRHLLVLVRRSSLSG